MKKRILILFSVISFTMTGYGQTTYWNTAHYANWDFGSGGNAGLVPYSQLPWKYITNMILFAGGTGGNQTNGTSPYYNVPGNLNDATTDSLIKWGRMYGVHIELDLGLGSGYNSLWNAGDAALQVWAHTVANIIVAHGYDGYDFDLEGMSGPPTTSGHAHNMCYDMMKYLHDTLDSTCSG